MTQYVSLLSLDHAFNDVELARITWDGQTVAGSGEQPLVNGVLKAKIIAPVDGKASKLTAADGLAFLQGLQHQYRSPYLRATEVHEQAAGFVPPKATVRLKAEPNAHETKSWEEDKHPRGQPGNPGQFGAGGSAPPPKKAEYRGGRQLPSPPKPPKHKDKTPKPAAADHARLKSLFAHVSAFGKALAGAPQQIQDKAGEKVSAAQQAVDSALDKALKTALPEDVADVAKETVINAVLSSVQESVFGAAFSDAKQATPTDWTNDLAMQVGPWAVCHALFSLCHRFATDVCKKLNAILPDLTKVPWGKKSMPQGGKIDVDAAAAAGKELAEKLFELMGKKGDANAVGENIRARLAGEEEEAAAEIPKAVVRLKKKD